MTKKPTQSTENSVEAADELGIGVLIRALRIIETALTRIEETKGLSEADMNRAVMLGQRAAPICAEIRKMVKAEKDGIREIAPATVREWLRLQSPESRARIRKDLDAMDVANRKSVLG